MRFHQGNKIELRKTVSFLTNNLKLLTVEMDSKNYTLLVVIHKCEIETLWLNDKNEVLTEYGQSLAARMTSTTAKLQEIIVLEAYPCNIDNKTYLCIGTTKNFRIYIEENFQFKLIDTFVLDAKGLCTKTNNNETPYGRGICHYKNNLFVGNNYGVVSSFRLDGSIIEKRVNYHILSHGIVSNVVNDKYMISLDTHGNFTVLLASLQRKNDSVFMELSHEKNYHLQHCGTCMILDENNLFIGTITGSIIIYNLKQNEATISVMITAHVRGISGMTFSNSILTTCSADTNLRYFRMEKEHEKLRVTDIANQSVKNMILTGCQYTGDEELLLYYTGHDQSFIYQCRSELTT
ncbi:hypothetical protein SNEBB_006115 [Seison nebaliae]|nr:hypothetical protein SNEBB_006115 [Seison nebaliae]